MEPGKKILINKETDRIYHKADNVLKLWKERQEEPLVMVQKYGLKDAGRHEVHQDFSNCLIVLWNPWKEKSRQMLDMQDDEVI